MLDLPSRGLVLKAGGERDAKSMNLLSPDETLDLGSRELVQWVGGGKRDAKSGHLLNRNEPIDLASRGLVLGGKAGRQI